MRNRHSTSKPVVRSSLPRSELVRALGSFRREWQRTTGAENLTRVAGPIGLIIADIAEHMGLTAQERLSVLGRSLTSEVSAYLEESVRLK